MTKSARTSGRVRPQKFDDGWGLNGWLTCTPVPSERHSSHHESRLWPRGRRPIRIFAGISRPSVPVAHRSAAASETLARPGSQGRRSHAFASDPIYPVQSADFRADQLSSTPALSLLSVLYTPDRPGDDVGRHGSAGAH